MSCHYCPYCNVHTNLDEMTTVYSVMDISPVLGGEITACFGKICSFLRTRPFIVELCGCDFGGIEMTQEILEPPYHNFFHLLHQSTCTDRGYAPSKEQSNTYISCS